MPALSLDRLAYQSGCALRWLGNRFPVIFRLLILFYCLLPLAPAPAHILPYPPQTVDSKHPLVCVHTRLTDEVEDLKVQRSLQMVREMGAGTIVEFFPWAYVEVSPGYYDWGHPDRIIDMARQEGLQVIARLGLVPDWALPKIPQQQVSNNYLTPDHFEDYARFVGKFVERYRGRVDHIIIWNDPNISLEWGYRSSTPAEYVKLLRLAYQAAHAANPGVVVLGGALAPTLEA